MKKHLSAIITSIGIMIGIILLILIQVIGKTNILDILVRCYAFSIPLWITIIVSLKRKEKQYRYFKKRPPPVQRVVCSRAISPCYQASVSRRWLSLCSSHIALDSSPPLKGHLYYFALTLKRVLIFFYAKFILHNIIFFLLLDILAYCGVIYSYCTNIESFTPKMSVSKFVL